MKKHSTQIQKNSQSLFYPKQIIKIQTHLLICDTKSGFTLEGDASAKLESLITYVDRYNSNHKTPQLSSRHGNH